MGTTIAQGQMPAGDTFRSIIKVEIDLENLQGRCENAHTNTSFDVAGGDRFTLSIDRDNLRA